MLIKKKRIYVYPLTKRGIDNSANPYIGNLITSFESQFDIVNKNAPSSSGILEMFLYYRKTDIFYLNWIENLPERKGGMIQTAMLMMFFAFCKLTGKKLVWTMHNKISHTPEKYRQKKFLFNFLLKNVHLIVTHSSEGLRYAQITSKQGKNKIVYLPHPVNQIIMPLQKTQNPTYDFILWGSMIPYKGIHTFFEYLHKKNIADNYSILVVGKFTPQDYLFKVQTLSGTNTLIINQFVNTDALKEYVSKSRYVLFTYSDTSVLSSGALMDTLAMEASIIGPDTGAFADLAKEDLIQTYHNFDHLIELTNRPADVGMEIKQSQLRKVFIENNAWQRFASNINELIQTI